MHKHNTQPGAKSPGEREKAMAKNLKKDYIKKLAALETSNGYKIDLANYIYNPTFHHNYPSFRKVLEETETAITYSEVGYFKYYDGTGEYFVKIYTAPKSEGAWTFISEKEETKLETSSRFSLSRLTELTEALTA